MRRVNRLLVVSHVTHYSDQGRLYAYGPYAREIDVWADLFPEVVIAAPCRSGMPPGDWLPFSRRNISILPQRETGGHTVGAKVRQALAMPSLVAGLIRAMRNADAIHVRCPGNLGLLGVVFAPFFSQYVVAKYAGQWNGYAGEPWSVRLQRALLSSRWWPGPVTVYGHWTEQSPQVVSFFTSMMTRAQLQRAGDVARNRTRSGALRVLFSGTLTERKRTSALLDGVRHARDGGIAIDLRIVGDGPERAQLEERTRALGIADRVVFEGALPYERALTWFEWADCLVLPSQHSEGWPKVVAEAMSYGAIAVAVRHGQVPAMLEGRGILLEHGTPEEIASALRSIVDDPVRAAALSQAGAEWAAQFSLENLRDAVRDLLAERWDVLLRPARGAVAANLTHDPHTI